MLLTRETRCAVWRTRWRIGAVAGLVVTSVLVALVVRELGASRARYRPQRRAPVALDADRSPSVAAQILHRMVAPQCILGPAALCEQIGAVVDGCADGDAGACRTVGQYLEHTPPYPAAAIFFFDQGCKLGDAGACARRRSLDRHRAARLDCDADRLACTIRARRDRDLPTLDHLCDRGVADACAAFAVEHTGEPVVEQTYLGAACQAGSMMACNELAWRLAPDCRGACFAPDPTQAAIASQLACEAGFTKRCPSASR